MPFDDNTFLTYRENTLVKTLTGAKQVLQQRGWCQRILENGAGQVCLRGALMVSLNNSIYFMPESSWKPYLEADDFLKNLCLKETHIWNNAPERTFTEVIELLDKAITLAER